MDEEKKINEVPEDSCGEPQCEAENDTSTETEEAVPVNDAAEPAAAEDAEPAAAAGDAESETEASKEGKGKRSLLYILIGVVIVAGLCGWYYMKTQKAKEEEAAAAAVTNLPVVTAMNVKRSDIPLIMEYTGQTNGLQDAEVRAQVGGIIIKKCYTEGAYVKEGDVLFVIDPSPYRATVNKNAAELKQSKVHMGLMKTEFDRTSALYAKNAASKANFDSAESNYKAAQQAVSAAASALRQSQIDLNWTSVRAPISGYSGRENYSVGNLVEAGSLMTSVVHSKQIYVDFAIPADIYRKYLKMTDKGQLKLKPEGVTVTLELGDGTKIDKKGKIDFQNQFVTPESASIKTRSIFENDGNSLYSGQFVRVFLNGYYIPKFIEIPLQSVLQVNDKYYVYRLNEEDIPEVVEVKLLMMIANSFVLESGLKDGERIIVDGIGKVQAGKKVKVEAK